MKKWLVAAMAICLFLVLSACNSNNKMEDKPMTDKKMTDKPMTDKTMTDKPMTDEKIEAK